MGHIYLIIGGKMTVLYEIFAIKSEGETKNDAIDNLLGYPKPKYLTYDYRKDDEGYFKHYTEELWAGIVEDELTDACDGMTHEQKLPYYNDSDLKDGQYLIDNGWYPPFG